MKILGKNPPSGAPTTSNGNNVSSEKILRRATDDERVTTANHSGRRMPGVILTTQEGLFEHGRKFALASGTDVVRDEDIETLIDYAEAVANDAIRPAYDPVAHPHDANLEREFQKFLKDRGDSELGIKHAQSILREHKDNAARAWAKAGAPPAKHSLALKVIATIALMTTIAAAAHDFIWNTLDEINAWLLSIITGCVFGALITLLILADDHETDKRGVSNWMGLAAGIGVGVAFLILRISGADGFGQFLFGLALSLAEIAIVLCLEAVATRRRHRQQTYLPLEAVAKEADNLVHVAEQDLDRRVNDDEEIQSQIDAHNNYIEERFTRATCGDQIREAAKTAVVNGYRQGVAENKGMSIGVRRSLQ